MTFFKRKTVTVFEVLQNTDMTEGRGQTTIFARVRDRASADRIAPGQGVYGSDATIRSTLVHEYTDTETGGSIVYPQNASVTVYDDAKAWAASNARHSHRAKEILAGADPEYKKYLDLHAKYGDIK